MVFQRLFQSPEVTDPQLEQGWQRALEIILSVFANRTAPNSGLSSVPLGMQLMVIPVSLVSRQKAPAGQVDWEIPSAWEADCLHTERGLGSLFSHPLLVSKWWEHNLDSGFYSHFPSGLHALCSGFSHTLRQVYSHFTLNLFTFLWVYSHFSTVFTQPLLQVYLNLLNQVIAADNRCFSTFLDS